MKYYWKKDVEKQKKEYDKKILDKLKETGYQDVISMVEGLRERIKNLEITINEKELEIINIKKRGINRW